jgi:hypothetical protein
MPKVLEADAPFEGWIIADESFVDLDLTTRPEKE